MGENGAAFVGFLEDHMAEPSQEDRQYQEYHDTAWKYEELTMPAGSQRLPRHSNVGHQVYQETYMDGRLYLGGTETSNMAGGFMEGAVNSANTIAKKLEKL